MEMEIIMEKQDFLTIQGTAATAEEAIALCGDALTAAGITQPSFTEKCIAREREYPTGLPTEIPAAIPHCKDDGIRANCICYLRLASPVTFRRMDDDMESVEADMVFALAIQDPNEHLNVLQRMMAFLGNTVAVGELRAAAETEAASVLRKYIA